MLHKNIGLWKSTPNTPVCHAQSEQKAWDLISSKYGQFLKHCYFKYKERKEWIWRTIYWCEKRKYLVALISQNEIFNHWFKLFSRKSSGSPGKYHPPLWLNPLPQENKKVPVPLFQRIAQNFWCSPAERGGGHYDHINEGWLFIGRFKVGNLPRMILQEVLAEFIYKPT